MRASDVACPKPRSLSESSRSRAPVTIDPPPHYFLAEQKSPYAEIVNEEVHKKYVNSQPYLQGFESQIKRR